MTSDDNPDEVFDNEPETGGNGDEPEPGGNGDEQSNRSFRYMMIGLFAIGALGVLLIGLIFISKQNNNAQFAAQQLSVQQTNEAVIALSQITPTPLPTETRAPTNTAVPPTPLPSTPTPAKKDLVETANAAGNFKTLTALLETAGLMNVLKGPGPYTIFAPTDDAFAQVSSDSLDALKKDPAKLAALLKYHVVEGALKPSDMATLTETKTLGGVPISITVSGDATTVNGVKVTKSDGESSNGVIYPIDSVLVPPDMKSVVIVQAPPAAAQPGKGTPASGSKGTAIAQVQGTAQANVATKPASGGKATVAPSSASTLVPTRVPPGAGTAAPSGGITNTKPISGTTNQGNQGLPTTGAGEDLFLLFLAAICLMMVIFAARRLRTMPR
jgi:uncharacterized surface protein with fasciclin (FAS1) repeats